MKKRIDAVSGAGPVTYHCKERGKILQSECRLCVKWEKLKYVTRANCADNLIVKIVKGE